MIYWKNAHPGDLLLLKSIKVLLEGHDKLLNFLFHPTQARLSASSEELLKGSRCFSSGEYLLFQMALDFWDGSGNTLFHDLYCTLGESKYLQVLKAIEHLKGREVKSIRFESAN